MPDEYVPEAIEVFEEPETPVTCITPLKSDTEFARPWVHEVAQN